MFLVKWEVGPFAGKETEQKEGKRPWAGGEVLQMPCWSWGMVVR